MISIIVRKRNTITAIRKSFDTLAQLLRYAMHMFFQHLLNEQFTKISSTIIFTHSSFDNAKL